MMRSSQAGRMKAGATMARRSISTKREKGAVLVFGLVILVAVTILVLSMLNTTSNSFVVVGNQQSKKKIDDSAKEALEIVLNSQTQFTNAIAGSAVAQYCCINGGAASTCSNPAPSSCSGYRVTVSVPYCYGAKTADGYSVLSGVAPEDTHWVFTAYAVDSLTSNSWVDPATGKGAQTVMTQGAKIRMGAGNCGTLY